MVDMQKTNITREYATENHVCHLPCKITSDQVTPWGPMEEAILTIQVGVSVLGAIL